MSEIFLIHFVQRSCVCLYGLQSSMTKAFIPLKFLPKYQLRLQNLS